MDVDGSDTTAMAGPELTNLMRRTAKRSKKITKLNAVTPNTAYTDEHDELSTSVAVPSSNISSRWVSSTDIKPTTVTRELGDSFRSPQVDMRSGPSTSKDIGGAAELDVAPAMKFTTERENVKAVGQVIRSDNKSSASSEAYVVSSSLGQ